MIGSLFGIVVFGLLVLAGEASAGEDLLIPEPESYRIEHLRAPTPASLRGARVVHTPEAEAIWRSRSAAFIDVLPNPPRPADLPAGTLWRGQRRLNIPGSTWYPDVGYAQLSAPREHYFRSGLERVTHGDRAMPIVLYCLRDCWMSWNAAKRAVSWAYTAVIWYPDGTDGWQDAGLPLAESSPAPSLAE
jgi:PQQ-dependent catabolism-associated CXXCW motif protein